MNNREHYNFYVHGIPSKYYRKLQIVPSSWVRVAISRDISHGGFTGGFAIVVNSDTYESPESRMVKLLDEECEDLYTFFWYHEDNLKHIVLAFKDHDDALKLKLSDLGNNLLDCFN